MVLIYWKERLQVEDWKVPRDADSPKWNAIGKELFSHVRIGGIDTHVVKEKGILPLLRRIKASRDLGYRDETVEDVLEAANTLALRDIPSIIFYDHRRLQKGIDSGGAVHSSIFLSMEAGVVKVTDPANIGSLGYQAIGKEQLKDSMSQIPSNLVFLFPKKHIKITTYDTAASLDRWFQGESP